MEIVEPNLNKWRAENSNKIQSLSKLISQLLEKYGRREISFKPFEKVRGKEKKKTKDINLSKKAREIYDGVPYGSKVHVVNGLLKTWVEDNFDESNCN